MIIRDNRYQERQLREAVDVITNELTGRGFVVVDTDVSQSFPLIGNGAYTTADIALLVDDTGDHGRSHDVCVELASMGGLAVVEKPTIIGTDDDRVALRRIRTVVNNVIDRLTTDYGGL